MALATAFVVSAGDLGAEPEGTAPGRGKPASVAAASYAYIGQDARVAYAAVVVPRAVTRLGAAVLGAVDRARWGGGEAIDVQGEIPADLHASGWQRDGFAGHPLAREGKLPLGTALDGEGCKCTTPVAILGDQRVAALYATTTFSVGDERASLRALRLRVKYRDGLLVWINGREVARRGLGRLDSLVDVAQRLRGPEWETIDVPVFDGLLRSGANRIALEVRPAGSAAGVALAFSLEGSAVARLTRGPVIGRVTPSSLTIGFETDVPVRAAVEYGPTAALGMRRASAKGALSMRHLVELDGLASGGGVHYRVVLDGEPRTSHRTNTAPSRDAVLRFAVYGDVRGGHDTHRAITEAIAVEAPDFVITTGDMVLRGSDEADWQRYFEVSTALLSQVPIYPVAGNHDLGRAGAEERRMNEVFSLWPGPPERPSWGHWYSFDVGKLHLLMLDSNSYSHREHREWVDKDLAAAKAAGQTIVAAVHDGPYSRGLHRGNRTAVDTIVPLLRKYGVALLVSGHDHLYQRGEIDGLHYIVSGGGGAPLYSVTCGKKGKPSCPKDGMKRVERAHHYVMVTMFPGKLEVCPKRPDRTALEPCLVVPLERVGK